MKKFHFILGAAGALLTAATATAQTDASSRLLPVNPGGPKTFGMVYDYASGTWTSTLSSAAAAAETLYDNTCSVGSFIQVADDEVIVDAGRLPSTSSPSNLTSVTGTLDAYPLASFDVAYCTAETNIDFEISFFEQFDACDDASAVEPTETFSIVGAPGAAVAGVQECWVVTIDLGNVAPGIVVDADGDGVYDGDPSLDNFGYGFQLVTAPANGDTGPLIAGDPFGILFGGSGGTGCAWGGGTYWAGSDEGTGVGTDDYFEIDSVEPSAMIDCFFFGGYLFANEYSCMYLELAGEAEDPGPTEPGTPYCFGNTASGNPCPCSNDNDGTLPLGGCAHGSSAAGALLYGEGVASIGADTLVLRGERGQPENSGLFVQAINSLDGNGVFIGDGIRCAGGTLKRLKVGFADGTGAADTSGVAQGLWQRSDDLGYTIAAGETIYYYWWIRDTAGSPCGNENNASNGYAVTWAP